jgi:hypothetical protein
VHTQDASQNAGSFYFRIWAELNLLATISNWNMGGIEPAGNNQQAEQPDHGQGDFAEGQRIYVT